MYPQILHRAQSSGVDGNAVAPNPPQWVEADASLGGLSRPACGTAFIHHATGRHMNTSALNLLWIIAVPITLALVPSGCASKKYVRQQTGIVNQRVSSLETKTKEQIAYLNSKHQTDISRVDERITTTDAKLAEVSGVAQQAASSAAEANKMAQANEEKIDASEAKLQATASSIATLAENAWNFQLIEKGDVTFGFNKADLDSSAKAALDVIAQKAAAMPRAEVELQGFTDKIGSKNYNLALSRRRAEAVARYLARQNVPLRGIHVIGLGEENPPASLTADLQAVDPNASHQEVRRLARRVYIRVYAPATAIAGEAARQQQPPN
jgi:outer membrane protein OmpA-like peptidoglycan-associated protein